MPITPFPFPTIACELAAALCPAIETSGATLSAHLEAFAAAWLAACEIGAEPPLAAATAMLWNLDLPSRAWAVTQCWPGCERIARQIIVLGGGNGPWGRPEHECAAAAVAVFAHGALWAPVCPEMTYIAVDAATRTAISQFAHFSLVQYDDDGKK